MKKLLLFAISFSFILSCFPETIQLKSGKIIEARIIEKTDKGIKVDIEGIPIIYYHDEIESIGKVKEISSSISKNNLLTNSKNTEETFDKKAGDIEAEERSRYVLAAASPKANEAYNLLLNRGLDYLSKRDYDQAILEFTEAIELNPYLPDAYTSRGVAYKRKKKYEQAISDQTKAIEVNPKYTLAYSNRATVYYAQGNFSQAIADYTKAIEIDPDLAEPYSNRACVYNAQGNFSQAVADCAKAIEINPKLADAYYVRGSAYSHQANLSQAISNYNKAIEIDPNYTDAYNNRGVDYFKQKDFAKAWEDVHKVEGLGVKVDAGFIEELKKASGREK